MKMRLSALFATVFFAGCAGTASNIENIRCFDGFWCDLTGAPTTYYQARLPANLVPAFPRNCLSDDIQVTTAGNCLMDDAVCYQLDTGAWCTAGRMPQCPAGSEMMEMDAPCPENGRCWIYSEGLRCQSLAI
ncbi:hypothetical protein PVT68_07040 [Microbulbifer bruguierae]|uniref:Lipoprotein n=1 Tax=Microbulbifer bruguierae TaxID=3029061 RepID=A0ABY8NGJ6_9GAMM|nr:hypothetical protein [Microbulbifer bruguierae]WGL18046.1 hypothetical protein PVT68_07040 [Microbulbifer bruguierae]